MFVKTTQNPKLPLRKAQTRRLYIFGLVGGFCAFLGQVLHLDEPASADQLTNPNSETFTQVSEKDVVDAVQVSGFIDPVMADFLYKTIDKAEREGIEALILQLNSSRSVISEDALEKLAKRIETAKVPVLVWVGPSGAKAYRGAARLALAADLIGIAPGSKFGKLGNDLPAGAPLEIVEGTVNAVEALKLGIADVNQQEAATLGTFIAANDGKEAAGRKLETASFEEMPKGPPEATLNVRGRLSKLPLISQLMHTVSSPQVAYLLLALGLMLLIFEFFTGGVGIAGGAGVVCLVLSAYGLVVLPTSPIGLGLIVLAMFGFSVDVQTGVPRVWTAIAVIAFSIGSLLLFEDGIQVGWITLVAGLIGTVLMMLAGLPSTVRSRFSTPTVGRESMIGEMGEAVVAITPEGVVSVRGALWKARTNRATPIREGDAVRIVAIEGTVLEVEPEEGAAKDYRERGSTKSK